MVLQYGNMKLVLNVYVQLNIWNSKTFLDIFNANSFSENGGDFIMPKEPKCKVAVVQAGSVVMNKKKGVEKTIRLIKEAGKEKAKIIVFPEAFIPAYPRGMSFGAVVGSRSDEGRQDFALYANNALEVPGVETDAIGKATKEAGAYVVIGVIERDTESS